jgi:hypothetical protein
MTDFISDAALVQIETLIKSWDEMIGDGAIMNDVTHTWIDNAEYKNFTKIFRSLLRGYRNLKALHEQHVNIEAALNDSREATEKLGRSLQADLRLNMAELKVLLQDIKVNTQNGSAPNGTKQE